MSAATFAPPKPARALSAPPVRTGVIGYGYWGPNLARNAARASGIELAAIAEVDGARQRLAADEHPRAAITARYQDILADPSIDAVVIATPTATHYDLVREALERGKHVLVTKPLTADTAQAQELVRLADAVDRRLMVDHTFLFTGAVQRMRQLLDAGELGSLYYYDSVRINLGLFQRDSNVIWDLAPHDISIMAFLIDSPVLAVSAMGSCHVDEGRENIAYLTMRFPSSLIAHVHVNWLAPAKVRRTIIGGSRKMLVYDDLDSSEKLKVYDSGAQMVRSTEDVYRTLVEYRTGDVVSPKVDTREALAVEMEHFAKVIQGVEEPISDGRMGLEVVRTIQAAQESLRRYGRPVKVER